MRKNVLRSFERWSRGGKDAPEHPYEGLLDIQPCDLVLAIYVAARDEPMKSILVPPHVAQYLTVTIRLRPSKERPELVLIREAPGAAFRKGRNILPFHRALEGDAYDVTFSNISNVHITLVSVVLVDQP